MGSGFEPIDFGGLAAALLDRGTSLVAQWLPQGTERNGRWYVGDFDGAPGESANVNLHTGQWIDNAAPDEDKGGDLISLYARVRGLNNGQAARELMRDLGWERQAVGSSPAAAPAARHATPARADDAGGPADMPPWAADDERPGAVVSADVSTDVSAGVSATASAAPARDADPRPAQSAASKAATRWRSVMPVPAHAPQVTEFKFGFKDKKANSWVEQTATRSWEYLLDGERFGYVARFERVDSSGELVKDTVPLTWCEDAQDARGACRWHWKTWAEPRPLYVPAGTLAETGRPVVVVEGEKCAEAGHLLLGGEFDFVSWPGGCKTWAMARWAWLMARTVILWPDSDAQRQRLTKAEREEGTDPSSKPYYPASRQPGMVAMVSIGQLLMAEHGCAVSIVHLQPPGQRAAGWDIADAIAEGWDADKVRGFLRAASVFVPPDDAARLPGAMAAAAAGISTPSNAGAGEEDAAQAWRMALLKNGNGATTKDRENVVVALDGRPDKGVGGIAEAVGVIAFNEFSNDVVKLKPSPWGTPAGAWAEVDDLLMGEWLVREHWLPSMPRGTLEEAVRMVAYRHRYHPVREYLQALTWDGVPRLATWLQRSCLEEDEFDDTDVLQRYLARVGTFFLMGMCARVTQPGVKFDYMLILEGAQGIRKSTLLKTLGGDWFADTGLVLGDKDSYQQIQSVWLNEIPELDAFSKADVMKIKAFVASTEDNFRASFDRRTAKYPRQVVFAGTTNEDHYLTDPTGNRRFWPVHVTRKHIDIDWVAANRDQLMAEAMQRVARGARMYPTQDEELELFVPQQQSRSVENAIESAIARYLYPVGIQAGANSDGELIEQISLVALLGKVGIGLEKLGPGRFHEKQAAAALRRLGWTETRSSEPGRPRLYRRPPDDRQRGSSDSADSPTQGNTKRATDDCPF